MRACDEAYGVDSSRGVCERVETRPGEHLRVYTRAIGTGGSGGEGEGRGEGEGEGEGWGYGVARGRGRVRVRVRVLCGEQDGGCGRVACACVCACVCVCACAGAGSILVCACARSVACGQGPCSRGGCAARCGVCVLTCACVRERGGSGARGALERACCVACVVCRGEMTLRCPHTSTGPSPRRASRAARPPRRLHACMCTRFRGSRCAYGARGPGGWGLTLSGGGWRVRAVSNPEMAASSPSSSPPWLLYSLLPSKPRRPPSLCRSAEWTETMERGGRQRQAFTGSPLRPSYPCMMCPPSLREGARAPCPPAQPALRSTLFTRRTLYSTSTLRYTAHGTRLPYALRSTLSLYHCLYCVRPSTL